MKNKAYFDRTSIATLGLLSKMLTGLQVFMLLVAPHANAKNWLSVQDRDVNSAQCMSLKKTKSIEMEDFLFSIMKNPENLISKYVYPFDFQDESPELIALFEKLHTPNYQSETNTHQLKNNKKCLKVLCAMEENYGKKEALMMLYIQAKFGLPTSPLASSIPKNYQKWPAKDLEALIIGLESLPPQLFPVKDRHLLRFLQGYTLKIYGEKGTDVIANARIDVFDIWDEHTLTEKVALLIHEMGHIVGSINDVHSSSEWQKLSTDNHVSRYAQENANEDFAETFASYRFAPDKLYKISKDKYNFFKNKVFNGFEFKQQSDCEGPYIEQKNRVLHAKETYTSQMEWAKQNQTHVQEELDRISQVLLFEKSVLNTCTNVYLEELDSALSSRELTYTCIKNVLIQRATEIELIDQNREGKPALKKAFSSLTIDRKRLQYEREKLRNNVKIELDRIYKKMDIAFYTSELDLAQALKRSSLKSPLLNSPKAQTFTQKIFIKTLTTNSELIKLKRHFFGVNFDNWLP